MRTITNYLLVALLIVVAGCTEDTIDVNGKGTITGRVVQTGSFLPLENVKISTNPSSSTVFTDTQGNFSLELDNGTYAVRAEKDGFLVDFESADVVTDESVNVVFELQVSTANNRPAPAATLVTPEDGATNVPFDVTFEWEAVDVDGDSLTFNVELRNANTNEIQVFEDLEVRELQTQLDFGTTYFWQVTASDGINDPVNSVVNSFSTQSFPSNRFHFVRKQGDNNVIFSADGEENEVQLTPDNRNSWRPRANRTVGKLAFLRSVGANAQLFTMDFDGRNVNQVTNAIPVAGFNLDEVDFSWANNGSALYYPSLDKLYRINTDGSGLTLVYQATNGQLITEVNYNNGLIALKTNDLAGYNVEIFTINEAGSRLQTVLTGQPGAAGGIELSIDNTQLLFTRDISGFENPSYRQINSRAFLHNFSLGLNTDVSFNKPNGTNDLDARYSPTDARIIVTNRSNDANTGGAIQFLDSGIAEPRVDLFTNSFMPDWE